MMEEILEEKKDRREMMETMKDFQRRLTVQEKVVETIELRNRQSDDTHPTRLDVAGPSSCRDWQLAGHSRDGLYPIQGKQEIEIVYCSFSKDVGKN